MSSELAREMHEHRPQVYLLLRQLLANGKPLLLRSDLGAVLDDFVATVDGAPLAETRLLSLLRRTQEAVISAPYVYLAIRPGAGRWRYLAVEVEGVVSRDIDCTEFLEVKEWLVEHELARDVPWQLEIDLGPFERGFPRLTEARSIGHGGKYLNRHLSGRLFSNLESGCRSLFEFLRLHNVQGQQLMLNNVLEGVEELRLALRRAHRFLEGCADDAEWSEYGRELTRLGFERGWGRTAAGVRATMSLLTDILQAPSPRNLERFLGRIPMIFDVVILSPHGFFGQSGVLGRPDTGGQVVYILDQVRALEREMLHSISEQGLDIAPQILVVTRLIPDAEGTSCDQPREPIAGTEHARIVRVPFHNPNGEVVPHWVSRFAIWPYLERFAAEVEKEVVLELGTRPDLVIGNYSDGNLVAALLSQRFSITQCNIAHALEKTKYLYSDLYWKHHEDYHHFSCQFTADLIAMNTADFIITSTYQEIAGTRGAVGQYESYSAFTMPGLYRVVNGVDIYDPKFNIVSPGADPDVYFSFDQSALRPERLREEVSDLVYGPPGPDARGHIERGRPLILAISRFDYIKNVSGLVSWYAESRELRDRADLLLVGGFIDPGRSHDNEEREQIERVHQLVSEHELDHQVRWLGMQLDKTLVGELYRHVADTRGVFVQPALFEAFGLTVIEAMSSGLPVFATCYGGPYEIIDRGESGFHIDPNDGAAAAAQIAEFLARCAEDDQHWLHISKGALARVEERYTWALYARRLLSLSRVYGFWKFISKIERQETRRYLEMFYGLMYRPRAEEVPRTGG